MRFIHHSPARSFTVGTKQKVQIDHCGSIELDPNEQVTFVFNGLSEYDVVQKEWGFYATPSLNGRLKAQGLHAALVRNTNSNRFFIVLVHHDCFTLFHSYLINQDMQVICWLDMDEHLESFVSPAMT